MPKSPKIPKPLDILTIGGATQDVFLIAKEFAAVMEDGEPFLVLPALQKVDVPDIANEVGGGAVNAAITFARLGCQVGCLAKVGADGAGQEISRILELEKVQNYLQIDRTHQTGISVIMKGPRGEDTIFTHRGAGYEYNRKQFENSMPESGWVYISSLAGDVELIASLICKAALQGARVAVNPGRLEIKKASRLLRALKSADVVLLNHTEAAELFKTEDVMECFRRARRSGLHTIVITDGAAGSTVLDGSYFYHASISKRVTVIDRTGAGDAYGAGLIAAISRGQSMQEAMSFAAANATSVIGYVGARTGVLRTAETSLLPVRVSVYDAAS